MVEVVIPLSPPSSISSPILPLGGYLPGDGDGGEIDSSDDGGCYLRGVMRCSCTNTIFFTLVYKNSDGNRVMVVVINNGCSASIEGQCGARGRTPSLHPSSFLSSFNPIQVNCRVTDPRPGSQGRDCKV